MTEREPVELRPAYEWTCEDCGRVNFVSAVVQELSPEDRRELEADAGVEPGDLKRVDLVSYPDEVECMHCHSEFPAKDMNDPPEGC